MESLNYRHISKVVPDADRLITESMKGKQEALYSRWTKVNNSMLGGFRFGNNYVIAGLSGHGKSWILNMLLQDFCRNEGYERPFKILHFGFEMDSVDEVLRMISSKTGYSYEELLSVKHTFPAYEKLNEVYEDIKNNSIYIVDQAGTLSQMYNTIEKFNKEFPEDQLIITVDHSLLINDTGGNELSMISSMAKMFMKVRKLYGSMNIILAQLNTNIESDERMSNIPAKRALHFPRKSDIHGSQQLFHAADYVIVAHQPFMLGITEYGRKGYDTTDLIAWHLIKARKGKPGMIRLRQVLDKGDIVEWADTPTFNL